MVLAGSTVNWAGLSLAVVLGDVLFLFAWSLAEGVVVQDMSGSTAAHASSTSISGWQLIISCWMVARSMDGCCIWFRASLASSMWVSWMMLVLLNGNFTLWEGVCTYCACVGGGGGVPVIRSDGQFRSWWKVAAKHWKRISLSSGLDRKWTNAIKLGESHQLLGWPSWWEASRVLFYVKAHRIQYQRILGDVPQKSRWAL